MEPIGVGWEILRTADDETFCELFLCMLETREAPEEGFQVLYQPWILERLQVMKERAPHVLYGSLLGPLKRRYPRQVFPGDLFQSMQSVAWERDGAGGMRTLEESEAAARVHVVSGEGPGHGTGWPSLDQYYTVRPGELTVVTGVASHMKSTFVQALALNIMRKSGWHFGLFSPEQAPLGRLMCRLIEQNAGKAVAALPQEEFEDGLHWVAQRIHVIDPPAEVNPTLAWILGVARQQHAAYRLQGLIIDPWNEIDHQLAYRQQMTQYISEALSRLRRFARALALHVWIVAHPTKMKKAETGRYAGKYPPPTPYDISDSAHWYNKADNCLCVWRDAAADDAEVEVHIQKVRFRSVGHPGKVTLTYQDWTFTAPRTGAAVRAQDALEPEATRGHQKTGRALPPGTRGGAAGPATAGGDGACPI